MKLYQLRVSEYGKPGSGCYGMVRTAFTQKRQALAAYNRALEKLKDTRHRIHLYLVLTPDQLLSADWVAICSDQGIPSMKYVLIRESRQLELAAA